MLPQLTTEASTVLVLVAEHDPIAYKHMAAAISRSHRAEIDARSLWTLYLMCASDVSPDLEIQARIRTFSISPEATRHLGEIAAADKDRAAELMCRGLATDHGSMDLDLLQRLIDETSP
jgi:hypothetical protein